MSDSESAAPAPHPTLGGKSLQSLERPRYKSWRKKYRKMRSKFDTVLEDNKRLFKEEQKLEGIAKRLREELDGLLELCLDLNQTPSIPPQLRFDVSHPMRRANTQLNISVRPDITPEQANATFVEYTSMVRGGHMPPLDLHLVRQQIDDRLAAQGVQPLQHLEASVPHTTVPTSPRDLPACMQGDDPPGYLTAEQEAEYLLKLDAKYGDPYAMTSSKEALNAAEEKHWADLTPRELERHVELLNPQSQHNWLKNHAKITTDNAVDDNESLASHTEAAGGSAKSRKRASGKEKNLAKQVGDRAVESARAREGMSPSAASAMDEDELVADDGGIAGSARKKGRDPDGTYRLKGGKGGSGTTGKGKRKRSGEDVGGAGPPGSVGGKKPRVEGAEAGV